MTSPLEFTMCKWAWNLLICSKGEEVALFYFRDGYIPINYDTVPGSWELRETIEKSQAIKCPDVYTQITNFKYIQYLINRPETWNHFGFSREVFESNRATFCDMKTIGDFSNSKEQLTEYIISNGGYDAFVMKPQKEGGANNYFGIDIKEAIEKFSVDYLSSHIFMKRIYPT